MDVRVFTELLGMDFYTGVPDSLLKPLCDYLCFTYGTDNPHHIIAANEGNAAALAAGYHLATGKTAAVYMQNSGEGNIINPYASLLHPEVYGIPVLFIIGWRGEPGIHDEPQHIFQGRIVLDLLRDLDIDSFIMNVDTDEDELKAALSRFQSSFEKGRSTAIIVRKGALTGEKGFYANAWKMTREEAIQRVSAMAEEDIIVSTTGKASRELFEIRESCKQDHSHDLLTVGSMGHCSSIALGIAMHCPDKRIWCIDGDGAVLMHMGSLAVIAGCAPKNFIHIIINNGAHDSVGGMPTEASSLCFSEIAKSCGYPNAVTVNTLDGLSAALLEAKTRNALSLIEANCSIGSRSDLGRPTTTAKENKEVLMHTLASNPNNI